MITSALTKTNFQIKYIVIKFLWKTDLSGKKGKWMFCGVFFEFKFFVLKFEFFDMISRLSYFNCVTYSLSIISI